MPRIYKKKPVKIEALQYLPALVNLQELLEWLREHKVSHHLTGAGIVLLTLEGDMLASPGDYIIRGIRNEFYPCKPDIFEATYEPIL